MRQPPLFVAFLNYSQSLLGSAQFTLGYGGCLLGRCQVLHPIHLLVSKRGSLGDEHIPEPFLEPFRQPRNNVYVYRSRQTGGQGILHINNDNFRRKHSEGGGQVKGQEADDLNSPNLSNAGDAIADLAYLQSALATRDKVGLENISSDLVDESDR
jgi:hypothetical protein